MKQQKINHTHTHTRTIHELENSNEGKICLACVCLSYWKQYYGSINLSADGRRMEKAWSYLNQITHRDFHFKLLFRWGEIIRSKSNSIFFYSRFVPLNRKHSLCSSLLPLLSLLLLSFCRPNTKYSSQWTGMTSVEMKTNED